MAEERQNDKVLHLPGLPQEVLEDPLRTLSMLQRICIYPSYLDSKKSVSEGRRVAAAIGKAENLQHQRSCKA